MSSSEEYLDSLLKAIVEGKSIEEMSPSVMQDMEEADDEQETSTLQESDAAINTDDIEDMYASMGAGTLDDEMQEEVPTDDEMLSGEPALDDSILSDEPALDDSTLSDELALDDSMLSDELSLDDGVLLGESPVDEGTLADKYVIKEETADDELALDGGMLSDEMPLDDSMLSSGLSMGDEILSDELTLDDGMLSDELSLGDVSFDELTTDDEPITDDFGLSETAADDLSLDELGLGDLGLEDLGLGEAVQDESEVENDFTLGDDFSLKDESEIGDNFALGNELEMGDDFALEDESEMGDDFALEDVTGGPDNFAFEDMDEGDGSFALGETEEGDADLSALLASMGADDDLSEINDLLEKSDQGVVVDDDIMAMLGSVSGQEEDDDSLDFLSIEGDPEDIREITPEELDERGGRKAKQRRKKEEKERKKREKQAKKAKNKNAGEGTDDLNDLLSGKGEAGNKAKNKGALSKFLDFLLEEDEEEGDGGSSDDSGAGLASLSDENKELLAELKAEDKKNAKKKDKKEKKAKKDKKDKAAEKAAKPKKPKKEKKKKEKIEEEPQVPEKKLSKKKVISVFVFCATIAASLIVLTIMLPEQLEKQEARVAFDQNQYTEVYGLLYGKELSEEDEALLQKSSTILKLQRKLDSYKNYVRMDMPLEALNALLEGVSRYQYIMSDAELYNVSGEVVNIYGQILDALANNYGLSEADALDIIASEDDITYSRRVQAVISGDNFGIDEPALPEGKQDVLPEEEEIIDRLEDIETENTELEGIELENTELEDTETENAETEETEME